MVDRLHRILSPRSVTSCIISCCFVSYQIILRLNNRIISSHRVMSCCSILCLIVSLLFCIVSYCPVACCLILHQILLCLIYLYDSNLNAPYHIVSYDIIFSHIISYYFISYHVVSSFLIILYRISDLIVP